MQAIIVRSSITRMMNELETLSTVGDVISHLGYLLQIVRKISAETDSDRFL